MSEPSADALYTFIGAFVEELARSGLRHVCLCPGSRSTPLAICLARHERLKTWLHLDERSAAFFALGLARASGEPVVLLCTSGTAAANFLPAVAEAHLSHLPLLVLTADRPPELRDLGAAQTMDQIRLYGSHVKWSVEMPTPALSEDLLRYTRATACRAVALSLAVPPGPVHLNFPLREPLLPRPPVQIAGTLSPEARYGRPEGQPFVHVPALLGARPAAPDPSLVEAIRQSPAGLIVCGPLDPFDQVGFAPAVAALAEATGYPVLADPLSGLRGAVWSGAPLVDAYDAFMRLDGLAGRLAPQLVLRFGAVPTAKPLARYLQRHAGTCRQIVISHGDWQDPLLLADTMLQVEPATFCRDLARELRRDHGQDEENAERQRWRRQWLRANSTTQAALGTTLQEMDELFEGRVFRELQPLLPDDSLLWVGSSMPVRDLDTFFPSAGRPLRLLANRGANGIDGVVSSALGAAAAGGGPAVLVIGDVSFYHDMNGLLAATRYGINLTVVVLNNDGGGIFSFLPQAEEPTLAEGKEGGDTLFEQLFGTPHGLDFAHAAALYGAVHARVSDWPAFHRAVAAGIASGGLHIVEVRTDRRRNVALHHRCWPAVAAALEQS